MNFGEMRPHRTQCYVGAHQPDAKWNAVSIISAMFGRSLERSINQPCTLPLLDAHANNQPTFFEALQPDLRFRAARFRPVVDRARRIAKSNYTIELANRIQTA